MSLYIHLVEHYYLSVFFFNDTATTEIYTLSLHDALPIFPIGGRRHSCRRSSRGREPGRLPRELEHAVDHCGDLALAKLDRKSTRLNSGHANISYAVFCLKKKKNNTIISNTIP